MSLPTSLLVVPKALAHSLLQNEGEPHWRSSVSSAVRNKLVMAALA